MTAQVIDGKRYARDLRSALSREVVDLAAEGSRPGLARTRPLTEGLSLATADAQLAISSGG